MCYNQEKENEGAFLLKILFYRYGSLTEPDLISAMHTMGFTVSEFTEEIHNKNYPPQQAIADVDRRLQKEPCDFIFSINFFPFLSEVCSIYHIPYLSWTVDSPVFELYTRSIKNPYNRTFIFDRTEYETVHAISPDTTFYLPLGANVSGKQKLFEQTSEEEALRFSHEIAFVGSLYTEKNPYRRIQNLSERTRGYLDGIMKAQENVYGGYVIDHLLSDEIVAECKAALPGFYQPPEGAFIDDRSILSLLYIGSQITAMERTDTLAALSELFDVTIYTGSDTYAMPKIHNLGLAKTLTEMPLIFRCSNINLNFTSKSIRSGLPLRIFDILSCGGFCLTNYQTELYDLFTPGEDLAVYGSQEELVDLIRYYQAHDKERREIARAGYEKVASRYTWEDRLGELFLTAYGDHR